MTVVFTKVRLPFESVLHWPGESPLVGLPLLVVRKPIEPRLYTLPGVS